MLRQRADQAFLSLLCALDMLVIGFCWLGAYFLRWNTPGIEAFVDWFYQSDWRAWLASTGTDLSSPRDVPPLWWCVRSLPVTIVVALLSFQWGGLYQLGQRWRLGQEIYQIFKATTLMLLLLTAATFYIRNPYESRLVTLLFYLMSNIGLLATRRGLALYFRRRRSTHDTRGNALIVGTGRMARTVAQGLRANNWLGLQPMGFVDDLNGQQASTSVRPVGTIDDLPNLVEKHGIHYVFIALPLERYHETRRIFRLLANTLVEIRLAPDLPNMSSPNLEVNWLEGQPILSLHASPHGFAGALAKRSMDVVLSLFGLILLSPLLLLLAAIIKCSDGGPIFFAQERMGLNGHRFQMYKFRSMRVNAEADTGPVWARENDKRRTWFGSFLRASSLDELPQLYNVLIGDMSLVGPRPERPYFINKFRETIPHYMLRHAVKSGITGWAQVNGWRGNTSLRKRVQYDLYYIANWSVWLDLRILFQTVFKVIWDKNAY